MPRFIKTKNFGRTSQKTKIYNLPRKINISIHSLRKKYIYHSRFTVVSTGNTELILVLLFINYYITFI